MLRARERQALLHIAREAVTARVIDRVTQPLEHSTARGEGAFVTLRVDQALRGCVGRFATDRPLAETVQ